LEDLADGPAAFLACSTSISSLGDVCYPAGEIEEGIEFTTSGADIGNTMVAVVPGDGFTLDNAVGSITFADFTILNFSTAGPVTSVGFDLYSLTTGSSVDVRVIGADGLIDTIVADVTTTGPTFVGFISPLPVVSVEIEDLTLANVELVAQVLFGTCGPPPLNDDPDTAAALTVGSVFEDFPVIGDNTEATTTVIDDPSCGLFSEADIWYSAVVPPSGLITFETRTDDGSITDTAFSVYEGEIGALVEVECNDDDGDGLFSFIDLEGRTEGEVLFLRAWEWNGGSLGTFQVSAFSSCPVDAVAIEITDTGETETSICTGDGIPDPIEVTIVGDGVGTNNGWVITDDATGEILTLPMAPPFDLDGIDPGVCAIWYIRYEDGLIGLDMGANVADLDGCFDLSNPILVDRVTEGDVCPPINDICENAIPLECDTTVVESTLLATDSGFNGAPDVFYTYTGSGSTEFITLSLCDGATDYDSLLRVFDDECNLVNEIAMNDDFCGLQSELTFISDGVTTYTIMVEGFGTSAGNFSMAVTCESCAAVEDLVADAITEVSAELSWTDPNPTPAMSYDLEWGLAGFAIGTGTVEAGITTIPFVLGGLDPNTAYDFYVTANCTADDSSEVTGPATFTTAPIPAPPGDCEYTLEMFDSFGDGWNGGTISVFRDGLVVLNNVALDDDPANDGLTGVLTFLAISGEDITTVLTAPGAFPAEISYDIIDPAGAIAGSGTDVINIESGTITADCTLSVGDNSLEGFSFFPNPAENVLNISAQQEVQRISIFNLAGQKVMEQSVNATSSALDVTRLATGAYILQVTSNEQTGTFKLIKK